MSCLTEQFEWKATCKPMENVVKTQVCWYLPPNCPQPVLQYIVGPIWSQIIMAPILSILSLLHIERPSLELVAPNLLWEQLIESKSGSSRNFSLAAFHLKFCIYCTREAIATVSQFSAKWQVVLSSNKMDADWKCLIAFAIVHMLHQQHSWHATSLKKMMLGLYTMKDDSLKLNMLNTCLQSTVHESHL